MNPLMYWILSGCLIAGGGWIIAHQTFAPVDPRLGDVLDLMDGRRESKEPAGVGTDRVGGWIQLRLPRPTSAQTLRLLRLKGRSVERYYTIKAFAGIAGFLIPLALAGIGAWLISVDTAVIAFAAIPVGLGAFLAPTWALKAEADAIEADSTEALLTYFDLVTLERLANRSAPQALRSAAQVSDAPVFAAIRAALERAQLEQRAPYPDLRALSVELGLPALSDLADVMKLDESGASLATALQARVKELRNAHLTEATMSASQISERMTFFMVVPALVFAGFFLTPPLLRLMNG